MRQLFIATSQADQDEGEFHTPNNAALALHCTILRPNSLNASHQAWYRRVALQLAYSCVEEGRVGSRRRTVSPPRRLQSGEARSRCSP